jgi:polyphosphate kinase
MRAAERGKQVAVVVELTARFDEARNIEWAQILEDAGVHVTYGLVTLKTHSKVMLVVRTEGGRPRTYCHVGTGNYHANTARLYGDFGLLTADQEIGADLVNHFHFLTGYAPDQQYRHLVVAPRYMRARFESLIRREIEHIRGGGTGRIVAKLNALDDTAMIQELYKASQAGVRIDLVVRGHCRLRPGVPGYSENIHVSSIVGRFLEHDRLYYFHNGGNPEVFIASADWRSRNLSERVEVMAPILSEQYRARLAGILGRALRDNRLAWDLQSDGCYIQRMPGPDEDEVSFQGELMQEAIDRSARSCDRGNCAPSPSGPDPIPVGWRVTRSGPANLRAHARARRQRRRDRIPAASGCSRYGLQCAAIHGGGIQRAHDLPNT